VVQLTAANPVATGAGRIVSTPDAQVAWFPLPSVAPIK
jgi:hypothetical protein